MTTINTVIIIDTVILTNLDIRISIGTDHAMDTIHIDTIILIIDNPTISTINIKNTEQTKLVSQ